MSDLTTFNIFSRECLNVNAITFRKLRGFVENSSWATKNWWNLEHNLSKWVIFFDKFKLRRLNIALNFQPFLLPKVIIPIKSHNKTTHLDPFYLKNKLESSFLIRNQFLLLCNTNFCQIKKQSPKKCRSKCKTQTTISNEMLELHLHVCLWSKSC